MLPPSLHALVQRCRGGLARLAAGLAGWLRALPPLPGGLKLWISLLSFGFLLAALARQHTLGIDQVRAIVQSAFDALPPPQP